MLSVLLLALTGCGDAEDLPTDPQTWWEVQEHLDADADLGGRTVPGPIMTAEELLADPSDHLGERVTVPAVLDRVLAPGAFTLTTVGASSGGRAPGSALVVLGETDDAVVGGPVVVEGTVRDDLSTEDVAARLDTGSSGVLAEFLGGPWLAAESVEPLD